MTWCGEANRISENSLEQCFVEHVINLVKAQFFAEILNGGLVVDEYTLNASYFGIILPIFVGQVVRETAVVSSACINPASSTHFEVGLWYPECRSYGQFGQRFWFDAVHVIDNHAESVSQIHDGGCNTLAHFRSEHQAGGETFAHADAQPVAVKLGKADSVSAVLGQSQGILIDKARKSSVAMELSAESTVTAPVSQGQRLGTLTVKAGDQVLQEVPLVASEAVERMSFGDLLAMVLKRAAMAKI